MHLHSLTFTKTDRIQLQALYEKLLGYLETGKGLPAKYFAELRQSLQTFLHDQKGLQGFWNEVQQQPDTPRHLHLIHKDKTILNLPWQMAVDQQPVYISKGLPDIHSFPRYQPQAGPLRILIMIASPEDLDHHKRLSYEEEEQVILEALAPLWETGQVQIDFTEDGSLQSLKQQLQLQPYHILYFSGHGAYTDNTGYLRLEDAATLGTAYVTAQQFGQAIRETPQHTPPLIILSGCQTAQGETKERFRGIADELMHMGVPAVIAMAFSITDHHAILFAAHLYEHLANRKPLAEAYTKALWAIKEEEAQEPKMLARPQFSPAQWLVPQLYCSRQVVDIVDWQAPGQILKVAAAKFIGGEEFLLLTPGHDYYFIGRRRENALLFGQLLQHTPVLLRGQGGVGKTALAEHLAKRLILQDPARYCFAFNETNIGADGLATQLRQYLEKEGHLTGIGYELNKHEGTFLQLDLLLEQVTRFCKPVWIFDNMESCQDGVGGPLKEEYSAWMNYVQQRLLHRFPVLFTGRYPIAEMPDIAGISLNEVPFVDFYRKCRQLSIRTIPQEINQPLFRVASLLYNTLGGSYRVLEFFDEIYKNDRSQVLELLRQMRSLLPGTAPQKELLQKVQDRLAGDAKKIVFTALLGMLSQQELETFHLLLYFEPPILQQALDRQLPGKDFAPDLRRLKDLTLIEEHVHAVKNQTATVHKFYYVTPLVRDWIEEIRMPRINFYPEYAGDYFVDVFNKITRRDTDMEAAFFFYMRAGLLDKVNDTGAWIASEYYRLGLYDAVLEIGRKVEAMAGVRTHEEVLSHLGLAYLKYGKLDLALNYLTRFLIAARRKDDKEKESIALNTISQVFYDRDDPEGALDWLEKSRQLAKEHQLHESEAVTLTNIGNIYADREQYDNALDTWRQSLQLRRMTGNRRGEITALSNISRIYSQRGEHRKVIQTLQKCLSIAMETGERQLEGKILAAIGMEYQKTGAYEMALDHLRKGLAMSEEIGDQEEIGTTLSALGIVHKLLGNYDEAIECLANGAFILQKFGYDINLIASFHLGSIYLAQGDYAEGLSLLLECLPAVRETGDLDMVSAALDGIGAAYTALGEPDKTIPYLQESISIQQSLGEDKITH